MKCLSVIIYILLNFSTQIFAQTQITKISTPVAIKNINDWVEENDSLIWLATNAGLYYLQSDTVIKVKVEEKYSKLKINTIFIDSLKAKWLGTYTSSIFEFHNNQFVQEIDLKEYFNNTLQLITCISRFSSYLLVTTADGQILIYDLNTKTAKNFKSPENYCIYKGIFNDIGDIFICTTDGLFSKPFSENKKWNIEKSMEVCYGIFKNKNEYWSAGRTESGQASLMLLNTAPATFFRSARKVWDKLLISGNFNKFVRFNGIAFLTDELIFIGTAYGLIKYNPTNGSTKLYDEFLKPEYNLKNVEHVAILKKQKQAFIYLTDGSGLLYKFTEK